ncbi:PREDICTED: olfactory receptor 2G3-like [Gekko japonicus]|uniref:Olfactory receptor n=1 Tax=Gekko japonicus TaxID=146911 RepID=A0ABM1L3Y2_GEKJA|nr:PREDICTED: olfactory receptor 2G3-like [Gekko japonicus]
MQTKNLTYVTEIILVGLSNHRQTQIPLFCVILLMYLLTVGGNLLIILLVRTSSHLQTPMYFFLMHLSGLEICYVTSTLPQMLAHLQSGNGTMSFPRCMAQLYVSLSLGGAECVLLGAMAYDRYLAICHPLTYAIIMGRWHQLQLASVSWATGFLFASINMVCTLRLSFCGPNRLNHFFCELPMLVKLACGDTHVTEAILFVLSTVASLGPLSVILTSYGLILSTVLRMPSASGRHKAFSTCASHLAVVTMFYGTIISMYLIPRSHTAPDRDKQIAVIYVVITPLLNPIIYTLRNKNIHRAVTKVLQRKVFASKY